MAIAAADSAVNRRDKEYFSLLFCGGEFVEVSSTSLTNLEFNTGSLFMGKSFEGGGEEEEEEDGNKKNRLSLRSCVTLESVSTKILFALEKSGNLLYFVEPLNLGPLPACGPRFLQDITNFELKATFTWAKTPKRKVITKIRRILQPP